VDHPRGSPEAPMSAAELDDKFATCARRALGDVAVEVAEMLRRLDELPSMDALETLLMGSRSLAAPVDRHAVENRV